MRILELVLSVVSGLVVCIPLVIKLVEYVRKAVQEKNWETLLAFLVELITEAEEMFETGAERKTWVMAMVAKSAESINYEMDTAELSSMIDALVEMTKKVNV